MTVPVKYAKAFHDSAFLVLPVVGSIAVFVVAILQENTALYAVAAGMLGVPGVKAATANLVESNGEGEIE